MIPVSALHGDNVVEPLRQRAPWYDGPPLLTPPRAARGRAPTATSTTRACRSSGSCARPTTAATPARWRAACCGPATRCWCSRRASAPRSTASTRFDGPVEEAVPPQSVTVVLADDIDAGRGHLICAPDDPPPVARRLDARLCWMADAPATPGARYVLKHTTRRVRARIESIDSRLDVERLEDVPHRRARAQRHRPRAPRPRRAGDGRAVRAQPRHRRLHPHRRDDQRHRRGRDGAARPTRTPARRPARTART